MQRKASETVDLSDPNVKLNMLLAMCKESFDFLIKKPVDALQIDAQRIEKFKLTIELIENTIKGLKSNKRPPVEMALCNFFLAELHVKCMSTYKKAFPDNSEEKRLKQALVFYMNTVTFTKQITGANELKNQIIKAVSDDLDNLAKNPLSKAAVSALPPVYQSRLNSCLDYLNKPVAQTSDAKPAAANEYSFFRSLVTSAATVAGGYFAGVGGSYVGCAVAALLWNAASGQVYDAISNSECCKSRRKP